jgi:hypothetical protein
MDSSRDSKALALAGGAFFLLAGFFLWRDLVLAREVLAVAAVAVAGVGAVLGRPRSLPALAPAALLLATVAAGAWYAVERAPAILPCLALAVPVAAIAVARGDGGAPFASPIAQRLRWYALGAALLAASWSFYFQYLTIGIAADTLARRLVPTLVWLALGLAFFVGSRLRAQHPAAAPAHVGLGLVAAGLVKAVFYDTTHLAGPMRVLVLAAVGSLLSFAAIVLRPPAASDGAR